MKARCIGILTAGGDCPGLNAAIRGVAKAALQDGVKVIGVLDGFRGLVENRSVPLDNIAVSGILTHGGTILGTSRDKPHKMPMGGRLMDMTSTAVEHAHRMGIDCLVCLGGGGTQKNALALQKAGLDVITLPKTIDNDVAETDVSFGFDTAMAIATEAVDRLHTTATSHNRIIVCEVMGHNAGWLALGAGLAGGADVILIPEIPYDLAGVAEHLLERRRHGKRFSIVVVAEGALSRKEAAARQNSSSGQGSHERHDKHDKHGKTTARKRDKKKDKASRRDRAIGDEAGAPGALAAQTAENAMPDVQLVREPMASRLARQLQHLTSIEARVTSLGHVQRGGVPTPTDRLLCTRLGTTAAEALRGGISCAMIAVKGEQCVPVTLEEVAGRKKLVPLDHPWLRTAQRVDTFVGDSLE